MSIICKRFTVSGTVQNVFFRDSTRKKANELSLSGWVRNTPTGKVELIACGEPEKIEKLSAWLWQGPPAAEVKEVLCEDCECASYAEFIIKN